MRLLTCALLALCALLVLCGGASAAGSPFKRSFSRVSCSRSAAALIPHTGTGKVDVKCILLNGVTNYHLKSFVVPLTDKTRNKAGGLMWSAKLDVSVDLPTTNFKMFCFVRSGRFFNSKVEQLSSKVGSARGSISMNGCSLF